VLNTQTIQLSHEREIGIRHGADAMMARYVILPRDVRFTALLCHYALRHAARAADDVSPISLLILRVATHTLLTYYAVFRHYHGSHDLIKLAILLPPFTFFAFFSSCQITFTWRYACHFADAGAMLCC